MDVSNSDADFDSYWEEEARNPNRNRIRIGRQYQATVQPILKKGESDGRKLEELETLWWKPDNDLTDQQLDQFLSVAKAVDLFARAIDKNYTEENSTTETSHKETTFGSDEVNTNSGDNTECDKSDDKNKDKENTNTTTSTSTSTSKDHSIQNALKGLSDFVSSHHPKHHDVSCRVSTTIETTNSLDINSNNLTTLVTSEWNVNEIQLFSRALEVCGKNFSAIKKDFLPWKSVKSIIEYYYLGLNRDNPQSPTVKSENHSHSNQSDNSLNTDTDSPISKSFALDILSSVSKFMTCTQTKTEVNNCVDKSQSLRNSCDSNNNNNNSSSSSSNSNNTDTNTSNTTNTNTNTSNTNSNNSNTNSSNTNNSDSDVKPNVDDLKTTVSGQEVKPLKAKPILPTSIQESNNSISTLGSLKFFLDGQLVLKLNAQQELIGQKCQWVESLDTAKKPKPLHKPSKRLLNDRYDSDHPNHSNHKLLNNEELDDVSNDSSDDSSMESNESALVPSPSAFIAKKAKVKLENNCLKPSQSPNSSLKDSKLETTNVCNRNIKTELSSSSKRDTLSPNIGEDDRKRRISNEQTSERRNLQNSFDNKWYTTTSDKSSALQPPKAHSIATGAQSQRHLHNTWSPSSFSLPSTSTYSVPSPSSVASNAIPVDLTRKSSNHSPFETKSLSTSSSAPNFNSYTDKDKNSKISTPSPPRLQSPFVFPFPSQLPLSPTQSQSKSKKEAKSSSNLCQKGSESRSQVKPSPPSSPLSLPSSTPPPLHSQMGYMQNPFSSYLPIYEQYYRYFYGYNSFPPNHSPGERQSSSQTPKENETNNKDRTKIRDGLLVDVTEPNCSS
ncbi:hybrid signal transduction histidine kinase M-like [Oppia nitens]|uniref:hybrid signal transduction histidine kinase M-like n=1 Tax=Oppia nitens TaxID=1686743 RepID=UPI0023DC49B4|nr:hybrid signal transduction histidine kinase M-like [Oppia nitens]